MLQVLDKVTAETLRFEAQVDQPVRYKDLVIDVHACETQASDEPYAQTAAHMEVQYQPEVLGGRTPQVARQVFRGWMFGDAPGLHPFQHPIYDLWVIACKTASPPARSRSARAPGRGQPVEVGRRDQGGQQAAAVVGARDLLGSELAQVPGHELGVEQGVAAHDQPPDQVDQRHLAGVGLG